MDSKQGHKRIRRLAYILERFVTATQKYDLDVSYPISNQNKKAGSHKPAFSRISGVIFL